MSLIIKQRQHRRRSVIRPFLASVMRRAFALPSHRRISRRAGLGGLAPGRRGEPMLASRGSRERRNRRWRGRCDACERRHQ